MWEEEKRLPLWWYREWVQRCERGRRSSHWESFDTFPERPRSKTGAVTKKISQNSKQKLENFSPIPKAFRREVSLNSTNQPLCCASVPLPPRALWEWKYEGRKEKEKEGGREVEKHEQEMENYRVTWQKDEENQKMKEWRRRGLGSGRWGTFI